MLHIPQNLKTEQSAQSAFEVDAVSAGSLI